MATELPAQAQPGANARPAEKIAPYTPRFGRSKPVVAVVGHNQGTVLSDFVIPYGVLAQAGVAHVLSVSTQPGLLKAEPLRIKPDSTIAEFDGKYPEGADYVIVPAVIQNNDPAFIAWLQSQARKGATMVSICNGAIVLANAGLTRGHRATAHWSSFAQRVKKYPETTWVKNTRYVADGKIVSSAGISAALPLSIALVEAIAGTARAEAVAQELGVGEWGTRHDSDAFRFMPDDDLSGRSHVKQNIGIRLSAGVDEIALALKAESYDSTLRGNVYSVAQSPAPVRSRSGLMIVPDKINGKDKVDWMIPEWNVPVGQLLPKVLSDISDRYGQAAVRLVLLELEYPM